jgi:hypothetical protein
MNEVPVWSADGKILGNMKDMEKTLFQHHFAI